MHFKTPILPLFTAVTVGMAPSAFADTTAPTSSNTFLETFAASEVAESHLRKWTVPTAGMYTLRVPANSGIQLRVDGNLLIDATGARLDDVGEVIAAFTTLQAGDHAIEVIGVTEENLNIAMITVNASGDSPLPLIGLTTAIDEAEANAILASRAGLTVPTMGGASGNALASTTAPFTPFAIGGGSSNVARAAATTAASGGGVEMASAALPAQGNASMVRQAAMGGGTGGSVASSGGTTSGGTTSGGGTSSGGTSSPTIPSSGGGGVTPSQPGTVSPTTPTTPVVTPTPTPAPSVPVVEENTVVVSPLTPPANPNLTEMIQLTAAGNVDGMVTNTGATLFGAVQADSVFDEIEVTFNPAVRDAPTTVSVGESTGQFAVRMFEEDFATASEVTVTLVGKLSSNDDVTSQPVSYTITGAPSTNGISQALSRLTFGATPDLYARVRALGFEAFVAEQLDPDNIDDRVFENTNPEDLLNWTSNNTNAIFQSLMAHDTARAAFSEKQLQEVMARFWANHFHAVTKGTNIKQQNILDREFFRENALGNFEDMLLYSASSPLMSQYLDNDNNRIDGNRGLNQNYAREILELSTVGVNGGYGNDDIDAIARIFTGWAYTQTNETNDNDEPREYAFEFFPERHDQGDKTIPFLATTIAGVAGDGGVQEGEQLIAILAQHSSTRSFVCGKLVQLLVADTPPANLTAACAAAWQTSGGEVIPMLQAILLDPSYTNTVEYQRNKVKNPFEFVVSTMRAFGAQPNADNVDDFYRRFREVYESAGFVPLFFGAPTGLPEVSGAWTSSAKMAASYERMNFIAERRENYGIDLEADVIAAGLETAEEVAGYLLTIATVDRFTKQEFDAVVAVLNGDDGFDLLNPDSDESRALEKAMGVIFVTPSFLLQ